MKLYRPAYLELLNYYLTLAMSSVRHIYVIQRNDTNNNSIFYMYILFDRY